MATITQTYASPVDIVVTGLGSLIDGDNATSAAVDNSTNKYLAIDLKLEFTGAAGSVDTVDVYLVPSDDNTDFATRSTEEGNANMIPLTSVALNTTVAVIKIIRFEQVPEYWKLYFENNSGGTLATEEVTYTGVALANA